MVCTYVRTCVHCDSLQHCYLMLCCVVLLCSHYCQCQPHPNPLLVGAELLPHYWRELECKRVCKYVQYAYVRAYTLTLHVSCAIHAYIHTYLITYVCTYTLTVQPIFIRECVQYVPCDVYGAYACLHSVSHAHSNLYHCVYTAYCCSGLYALSR